MSTMAWILPTLLALHCFAGWVVAGAVLPRGVVRRERLCAALLIGLALYHGVPVILGWLTGLMSVWWAGIGIGLSGGLAYAGRGYLLVAGPHGPATGRALKMVRRRASSLIALSLIGTLLVFSLISGARLPIRAYDAATYHSINPMQWWATGQFTLRAFGSPEASPHEIQAETFPNPKAVTVWLALVVSPDGRGTALAQWPFYLLLPVAVAALSRRVGLRGAAGWWLGLLACLIPEIFLQSLEAYADLMLASLAVAGIWAGWLLWDQMGSMGRRRGRGMADEFGVREWIRVGLVPGVALAWIVCAKPTGALYAVPGLGVLAVLLLWGRAGSLSAVKALAGVAVVAAVVGLALGGPWYARALFVYGNPVFPFRAEIAGQTLPGLLEPGVNHDLMRIQTGRVGWAAFWNTLCEIPRTAALSSWTGGLGAVTLIFLVPTFLLGVVGVLARWLPLRPVITALVGVAMLTIVPTAGVARFLLVLPLATLPLLGAVLGRCDARLRYGLVAGLILVGGYDLARGLGAWYYQQRSPATVQYGWSGSWIRPVLEDRFPGDIGAATVLSAILSDRPDEVVASRDLWPWHGRPVVPRGDWFRRLGAAPMDEMPEAFLQRVRATGATLLHVTAGTVEWELAEGALNPEALLFDLMDQGATYRHGPLPVPRQRIWRVAGSGGEAGQPHGVSGATASRGVGP